MGAMWVWRHLKLTRRQASMGSPSAMPMRRCIRENHNEVRRICSSTGFNKGNVCFMLTFYHRVWLGAMAVASPTPCCSHQEFIHFARCAPSCCGLCPG